MSEQLSSRLIPERFTRISTNRRPGFSWGAFRLPSAAHCISPPGLRLSASTNPHNIRGKAGFTDKEGEKKVRKNLLFGNLIINLPSVLCGMGEVYSFV